MTPRRDSPAGSFRAFRLRLSIALALLVVALTVAGLWLAQKRIREDTRRTVVQEFHTARASCLLARSLRFDQVRERCASLVDNSRIHAALEDEALDLLYPSARDELRDLLQPGAPARSMRTRFYRFLDAQGRVIPPLAGDAGALERVAEVRLALPRLPADIQIGYLPRGDDSLEEIIAAPIVSSETRRPIAALVVGLEPNTEPPSNAATIITGIITENRLWLPGWNAAARDELLRQLSPVAPAAGDPDEPRPLELSSGRYLSFRNTLNATSAYPRAEQVFLYPLADSEARARQAGERILAAGALLLIVGLGACHWLAARLARPVEEIALDSEQNARGRIRAEAALELTQAELERAARFSANASHQLKTPVAVMRAGLEEVLSRRDLPAPVRMELEDLVGETGRLGRIIEELLLLSRLDARRLKLRPAPVDLALLVEACVDDCSVLHDPFHLEIETKLEGPLWIWGEKGYLEQIFRNLLENARHYNRAGGRVLISAETRDGVARLIIGNTGRSIAADQQARLFERFHRADAAENTPGTGLGLSLARELTRLHGGEIRLIRSAEDWTEFAITLPVAPVPASS